MNDAVPTPGIGDNLPPEGDALTERLAEKYEDLPKRFKRLQESLDRAPAIITTEDQNKELSDLKREFRSLRKTAESHREEEKKPFREAGERVDGFFHKWSHLNVTISPVAAALAKITERKTIWEREVAATEKRKREAEERAAKEEADRLAREAERVRLEAEAREAEAEAARKKAADEQAARERARREEAEREEAKRRLAEEEAAARAAEARDADERERVAEINRQEEAERLAEAARQRSIREEAEATERSLAQLRERQAQARSAEDLAAAEAAEKAAEAGRADLVKAKKATDAKAADMSRSRSDRGSLSSLHTFWTHRPKDPGCLDKVDRGKVDITALRPHLSMECLEKAVDSYVAAGGRKLRGVTIFEATVSRG